jgi:hypothetical protein
MDTVHPYCLFRNLNQRMVILRCVGPERFFHEKVIFPFEDWLFSCPPSSDVEIWSHGSSGTELVETFPASDLLVDEQKPLEVTAAMNLESEGRDDQLGLAIAAEPA